MRGRAVVAVAVLFGLALLLIPVSARAQETQPAGEGKMTLNLPDVPFGTFLKLLAEKSDLKLVTSAEIARKTVSCYLPEVTAKEALDAVCGAFDLSQEVQPETGVIVIKDSETAFFPLEHVGAKEAQTVVPALISANGKVSYDEKNNVVSVRASRQEMANVRAMISKMDETPRQVLIEATIAEITDSVAEQMGIRWDVDASFRGAARLTKLPFKGSFVSMDEDAKAWTYGFISFQDFFVQLQFMEQDGTAKILATPRITVLDRKSANFQVLAHTVVATKITRQEGSLELVNQEPIYADVGVSLTCVPHIHPDNKITLDIAPSVSTAAKSRFFSEAVDTFNRSATTTVMADDGETIVIGGLLRNDATETIHKVPYISDIPILGYLFTHRDISNQKTNLVVFLTLHLLDKEKIKKDVESRTKILMLMPKDNGDSSPAVK